MPCYIFFFFFALEDDTSNFGISLKESVFHQTHYSSPEAKLDLKFLNWKDPMEDSVS